MKILLILSCLTFLTACATHAPMSEMVMFNIERNSPEDSVAKYTDFGIGMQYSNVGPLEKEYDKKNEQDYPGVDETHSEGLALSMYVLNEDKFGFGYSLGGASGLDLTAKIREDYYGTVTLSANTSVTVIFQKRFVVDESRGIATGVYLGRGVQPYYSECRDCYRVGPDRSTSLYYTGLRSLILFRNPDRKGSGLTGSVNLGYAFEVNEPYLGFSIAFMTF